MMIVHQVDEELWFDKLTRVDTLMGECLNELIIQLWHHDLETCRVITAAAAAAIVIFMISLWNQSNRGSINVLLAGT